jgi:hypothetical protein
MRMLLLLLIASAAFSAAAADRKPLAIAAITSQQAEIRAGVQAGTGRYKDMPARTKEELLSRQSELLAVVDGKRSSDDLSEKERLQVFNNLEWIEAAINNAEDERMVCNREKTLGSNRAQKVCKTVAQIREEKEEARRNLNSGCAGGVCGNP